MNSQDYQSPKISVCIANYNGADVLLACIESVLRQKCSVPVEIIIHDDASSDNSVELLILLHPNIYLIRSDTNVGFCISNNRMVRAAQGEYILLLNNDATLREGALQAMYDKAISNFEGIISVSQYQSETGLLLDYGCRMDWMLMPIPITDIDAHTPITVMGACLWIPKKLWNRIGGFPEWIGSIGEDTFLCLAAWQAGAAVSVINNTGYDHIVGLSFGGGKPFKDRLQTTIKRRFLSERNRLCVLIIFCPTILLPLAVFLQINCIFFEAIIISIVNRNLNFFKKVSLSAISSAWSMRKIVINERKKMRDLFGPFPLLRWLSLITIVPQKIRAVLRYGIPEIK